MVLNVLLVVDTVTSLVALPGVSTRIINPRAVMFAPPGLDTVPVTETDVLAVLFRLNVSVGVLNGIIDW